MAATLSINDADIYRALGDFLAGILPSGVEVIQAQGNRVPMPSGPCVVMQVISRPALDTGRIAYDLTTGAAANRQAAQITVQLDAYREGAPENVQIIAATFRTAYACRAFVAAGFDAQPLYASEPRQMQFIDDTDQYTNRWGLDVVLQVNPVITLPQDLATEARVTLTAPR